MRQSRQHAGCTTTCAVAISQHTHRLAQVGAPMAWAAVEQQQDALLVQPACCFAVFPDTRPRFARNTSNNMRRHRLTIHQVTGTPPFFNPSLPCPAAGCTACCTSCPGLHRRAPSCRGLSERRPLVAAAEQRLGQLFPAPATQQEAEQRAALALAHRSCVYLGCCNVAVGCKAQACCSSKKCGDCRQVRYRGETCCRADWRAHRRVCAALAAAAAPPAAPPPGS